MEDLKGNPNISDNRQQKFSKPVVTNAVLKNESEGKKFGKRFFSEDAKTVGGHVAESVIIPTLQKLISDAVKSAIDWIIYGSKGSRPQTGVGTISYSNYYNRNGLVNTAPTYSNPMVSNSKPTLYAVNEYDIPDIGMAEEVLIRMKEAIESYGMVSVADFYDLVNQRASYTDQKWGWVDLKNADIIRVDNGYRIRFPKAQPIEK